MNIEHPEVRQRHADGFSASVRPDVVSDAEIDLRVLADLPGHGKVAVASYGGRLGRVPGYAALQDDDGQIYLILAVPLDEWPEEIR